MKRKLVIFIILLAIVLIIVLNIKRIPTTPQFISFDDDEIEMLTIDGIYPISQEKGTDENGDYFVLAKYSPKKLTVDEIHGFITTLHEAYDYIDIKDDYEEEYQLAAYSKDAEKMLLVLIHHDEKNAYIKYTKTDSILSKYKNLFERTEYEDYEENLSDSEEYKYEETN